MATEKGILVVWMMLSEEGMCNEVERDSGVLHRSYLSCIMEG